MKRDKIVLSFAFLILALATAVSSYNVWSILAFNILPPGDLAPIGLMGLKAFSRGSNQAISYGVTGLFSAVLSHLGLAELDALSVTASIMFALIPLTVAYLSWVITRNHVASAIAGLLAAFFPAVSQPIFIGDYPLLSAIALTMLSLTLSLCLSSKFSSRLLAGAILACALAIFADASAPTVMICPLIIWSAMSWKEGNVKALCGLLTVLMLTIGLWLFLLPFDVCGYAVRVRGELLGPGISSSQVLLILLAITTVAGLVSLYFASRKTAIYLLGWLTPLVVLACLNGVQYLLFAVPVFVTVCSHLLLRIPRLFKLLRHGEDILIEFHLERLLAAILLVVLGVATIFYYPYYMQAYGMGNVLSEEEVAIVKDVSGRLRELVTEEDQLLAAPPRISAWLGAFGGLNVVAPVTDGERWELDAFTSTTFRLMSPYMMVDEWQPFSSRRSPFIYSYDGRIYAFILHVDDGTNVVRLIESNITWREDLHGMKLINYMWLETADNITLVLNLWKKGFNATKTISLAKNEAQLTISYYMVPNRGVQLIDMALPVYIEGRQKISNSSGEGWIQLDMPHVTVRFSYEGASTQPALAYSDVQDFVVANFTNRDGVIHARLKIELLNPRRSPESVRYMSFFDLIKKWPVSYLMTYAAPEGLLFLQDELEKPVGVLEVIDSFNRVIFNHEGFNYVEAPADAMVISESTSGQARNVTYQTAGLIINKHVDSAYDNVRLRYEVQPLKEETRLISMSFSLWIPWSRTVFIQEGSSNTLKLMTDAGNVTIKVVEGNLTFMGLGPDPEFRQPRVQAQFSLNPQGDAVELIVSMDGEIGVEYVASNRPAMEGSDRLIIKSVYMGIFKNLYQDQTFALYKIVPP